jgi:DNA repair helicase XPB1
MQATDFLTAIAEPLSRPQFIHEYRITDSSLYGAVSVGLETDLIINRLQQMSKVELRPEMIDHIKRKTATYGKAKLVLRNGTYRISSPPSSIVP